VQMDYDQAQKASEIFDYGIASKGMVTTDGVARIRGATEPASRSRTTRCSTCSRF